MHKNIFTPLTRVFGVVLATCVLAGSGGYFYVHSLWQSLPPPKEVIATLSRDSLPLSSEVFDKHGRKIGEFAAEKRYYVPLKDLPQHVVQGFLSAEDKDFYSHAGVSPAALLRALRVNLAARRFLQGGSTITQQLTRVYFLGQEKTIARKIKEMLLAVAIDRSVSKDQILELYLNKIYLGNGSFGVEAAARNYFRKSARELTLAEGALLAGLPKAPSRDAPNKHYRRAKERQAFVLRRMYEDKLVTRKDMAKALATRVKVFARPENHEQDTQYFLAEVKKEIDRKLELSALAQRGLRVYTTLDLDVQAKAKQTLSSALESLRSGKNAGIEGALLTVDPTTGAVLAMQGGADFRASQFNRAAMARRPLGSAFFPFIYALALERGYSLASPILEEGGGGDEVGNAFAARREAATTFADALVYSRPLHALSLTSSLGAGTVEAFAEKLGFQFDASGEDLAWGEGTADLKQVARAYGAIANGGLKLEPYLIEKIADKDGTLIYQHKKARGVRVMSEQAAFIMEQTLREVVERGVAGRASGFHDQAAGFAGSTSAVRDAWCAAFVPQALSVVWLGVEAPGGEIAPTGEEATEVAAALWKTYMRSLPQELAFRTGSDKVPLNISFGRVPGLKTARMMPFVTGTEPL